MEIIYTFVTFYSLKRYSPCVFSFEHRDFLKYAGLLHICPPPLFFLFLTGSSSLGEGREKLEEFSCPANAEMV